MRLFSNFRFSHDPPTEYATVGYALWKSIILKILFYLRTHLLFEISSSRNESLSNPIQMVYPHIGPSVWKECSFLGAKRACRINIWDAEHESKMLRKPSDFRNALNSSKAKFKIADQTHRIRNFELLATGLYIAVLVAVGILVSVSGLVRW